MELIYGTLRQDHGHLYNCLSREGFTRFILAVPLKCVLALLDLDRLVHIEGAVSIDVEANPTRPGLGGFEGQRAGPLAVPRPEELRMPFFVAHTGYNNRRRTVGKGVDVGLVVDPGGSPGDGRGSRHRHRRHGEEDPVGLDVRADGGVGHTGVRGNTLDDGDGIVRIRRHVLGVVLRLAAAGYGQTRVVGRDHRVDPVVERIFDPVDDSVLVEEVERHVLVGGLPSDRIAFGVLGDTETLGPDSAVPGVPPRADRGDDPAVVPGLPEDRACGTRRGWLTVITVSGGKGGFLIPRRPREVGQPGDRLGLQRVGRGDGPHARHVVCVRTRWARTDRVVVRGGHLHPVDPRVTGRTLLRSGDPGVAVLVDDSGRTGGDDLRVALVLEVQDQVATLLDVGVPGVVDRGPHLCGGDTTQPASGLGVIPVAAGRLGRQRAGVRGPVGAVR